MLFFSSSVNIHMQQLILCLNVQILFIVKREFRYVEHNGVVFIAHLLQADLFFHWYKIPQPVDLKLLSLTVRLQLILIY